MASKFFDKLIKATGNDYAGLVSEGNDADVETFVDMGSYALNALFSGSIYGGLPSNKVSALAGEPSTGKTFYALQVCKQFLNDNPKGHVFYFESESAVTTQMLTERGIDITRFVKVEVTTIQDFRSQAVRVIDEYLGEEESKREPLFMVLDSLGMLSTTKEVTDIAAGEDKRDMTRAQLIRGAFRVLTLKLGRAKVALLVTNHTYEVVGAYIPTKKMGGGDGLNYAASSIVFLSKSKKKDKTTKEVTGAIITVKNQKSRMTVENKDVDTLLDYQKGLDRYYGLLQIAETGGLVTKEGSAYVLAGVKTSYTAAEAFENGVYKNPSKYFTKEVLDKIDAVAQKEFKYGSSVALDTQDAE